MKNTTPFFRKGGVLVAICLLCTAVAFAQPVIKVPQTCEVLVAGDGIGATTGFGGAVGDNGIVAMPDPFDFTNSAGDFNYVPNNSELIGWALLGDLSMQTETVYDEVLQPNGPFNTINLQSYNKLLRNAEIPSASQSSLDVRWGRSKGRVIVSYAGRSCNGSIKFDILKRYTQKPSDKSVLPPIFGSDCVIPNTIYTYSVDQIASDNSNDEIGFDKYYWSGLPEGSSILYSSADNSSITFLTGPSVAPFTIQCCFGRANGWDGDAGAPHVTCISKQVSGQPPAPVYTVAPPTCHPTGTGSFVIVYPNVVLPLVYTWTSPNSGWIINPAVVGATNTTITVNTTNNNPGGLILTISGTACGNVVIPYQVNRRLTGTTLITPVPNAITPTATGSNCMLAGTNTGTNQFFLGSGATANNTTWSVTSVPPGAVGITLASVLGQPNSTVAVNIAANATINATYTLTATANTIPNCNTSSATYTFNVRPLTPTISGSPCVTKGALTSQTYTCTASTGASYNWVFPAGWSPATATTTTNAITVTPSGTMAVLNGNVTVTATGLNGCSTATSVPFPINYLPVAPTLTTTTCMAVGSTSASAAITNAQTFGTYSVTSSPLGITSSGVITSGNLALTIPPTLTAGNYSIIVVHNAVSPCGTASTTLSDVTVAAGAAAWAAGFPSFDSTAGGSDVYRINTQPALTTYQWYTGPSIFTTVGALTLIPSPGTNPNASFSPSGNQMTLYGATALSNPQVYCIVTPPGGCATIISAPRGTHGTSRQMNPKMKTTSEKIVIYPNPNDGSFNIQINETKENTTAILTDMTGKEIDTYKLFKGENKIKNRNLAAGTYIIRLQIDGKTETRQLIVK